MSDAIEPQLDELRRRARRRLIGAVVLALAAAVLVPMLLESDPKPLGEDVSVKIPPVDEGTFVSKLGEKSRSAEGNSPATAKPVPATAPMSSDTATAASAKDASREAAASPSTTTKRPPAGAAPAGPAPQPKSPAKEVAPAPAPAKDSSSGDAPGASASAATQPSKPASDAVPADAAKGAKASAAAFSVQLAAFADDKGANALANRLKQAGHPAYTEAYATSRGTLWRVRVGPYVTREAAETARTKLKAEGQSGIIATAN